MTPDALHDSVYAPHKSDKVVTFDNLRAYPRTIRASAVAFEDPASRALQERIERIGHSDATALIIGETGTGKELVARQLHRLSARRLYGRGLPARGLV